MAKFVAFKDIECVYPISGQYGTASRVLYYGLILFVIIFRRKNWLTAGAAATCMIYSGTAAIHTLVLAPSLGQAVATVPEGNVTLPDGWESNVSTLATDLDTQATIAIVGASFMVAWPMATWSSQFHRSEAKPILTLWICLLVMGIIGHLTIIIRTKSYGLPPRPGIRFCSPGYKDTLPFSGNPTTIINDSWNDTVWTYFSANHNLSCFYLCLATTYFLRQQGDLHVVKFAPNKGRSGLERAKNLVPPLIWGSIPITALFSITTFILKLRGHPISTSDNVRRDPLGEPNSKTLKIFSWALNFYTETLIPTALVVFLSLVEVAMRFEMQSEEIQLVGQWAPLVGAALVLIAALVGKYWPCGEKVLIRFWERRKFVRRNEHREGLLESLVRTWKDREERSGGSQNDVVIFQEELYVY